MADKIVQLADKEGNNLYPVTSSTTPNIIMTTSDPGEGAPLAPNNYVAVYGAGDQVETEDIADAAVTANKINFSTLVAYNSSSTSMSLTTSSQDCLTVDVSNLPPNKNFIVFFSGAASGSNTITGLGIRCRYNNVDGKEYTSVTTWGKTVTGLDIFTKVSGVNSLFLRARKDNDSSVTLSNRVCYCMVIN